MGECNLGICGDRVVLNKHFNFVRGSVLTLKLRNLRQKFNTEVTELSVLGMWAEYITAAVADGFICFSTVSQTEMSGSGLHAKFSAALSAEEYKTEIWKKRFLL